MSAADAVLRKRLAHRSWRRGMRETDLLLGPFADAALAAMTAPELHAYARLLDENDQDIFGWILAETAGRPVAPDEHARLIAAIAALAGKRSDRI